MVEETSLAQILLDQLHELNLQELYSTKFQTKKARVEHTRLTKQKLRLIKKRMKDEIKEIKAKYDGRVSYEAALERRYLAEYTPLDNLIPRLELFLKEFELKGTDGPVPPTFGTLYVGELEDEDWNIFTPLQTVEWTMRRIRQFYQHAKEMGQDVMREISRLDEQAAHAKKALVEYIGLARLAHEPFKLKSLLPSLYVTIVSIFVVPLAVVIIMALAQIDDDGDTLFLIVLLGLTGFGFLISPYLSVTGIRSKYHERKRESLDEIAAQKQLIQELADSKAESKAKLGRLRQHANELKQKYADLSQARQEIKDKPESDPA